DGRYNDRRSVNHFFSQNSPIDLAGAMALSGPAGELARFTHGRRESFGFDPRILSMSPKVWLALASQVVWIAVPLFVPAGTVDWPWAWAYLLIYSAGMFLITRMLVRHNPALLAERMRSPIQAEQPLWDKVFMATFIVLFTAWLVLMGLDAGRFRW